MMAEEFIDDIIGSDTETKTEAEMTAEIQGTDTEKAEAKITEDKDKAAEEQVKVDKAKGEMGGEADTDVVQEDKVAADEKAKATDSDGVKELAAQLGWREDHTGDAAVDAKTYILKSKDIQKSMGQHNRDLKEQLQALSGSVESLKKHNDTVYKSEVKRLTSEVTVLKKERRAAIELADVGKVDELDVQIEAIQKDINEPKAESKQKQVDNPAFDDWVKDNDWYLNDADMAQFADTVAQQYNGAPLDRVYTLVRAKVKEVFPDKFGSVKVVEKVVEKAADAADQVTKNPVGPKSPVESSSAKVSGGTFTKTDLTPGQMKIMKQFVQGGIMTEEQYINDIAKMQ